MQPMSSRKRNPRAKSGRTHAILVPKLPMEVLLDLESVVSAPETLEGSPRVETLLWRGVLLDALKRGHDPLKFL